MVRETWTDERLGDLNKKVDDGFARMDSRFQSMEERFDAKFDALNRTLIGSSAVIVAALIGLIATQL